MADTPAEAAAEIIALLERLVDILENVEGTVQTIADSLEE